MPYTEIPRVSHPPPALLWDFFFGSGGVMLVAKNGIRDIGGVDLLVLNYEGRYEGVRSMEEIFE
jgi:hypothetical protein